MKDNDKYLKFEKLLRTRSYEDLTLDEMKLVDEFSTREEYEQMIQVVQDFSTNDFSELSRPEGGAEAVWSSFAANSANEIIPFRKRKVSILWPLSLAASVVLLLFLNFPAAKSYSIKHAKKNSRIISLVLPVYYEIVREIPVYISVPQNNEMATNNTSISINHSSSGDIFVPSPESIEQGKSKRQGVNTSEMGDLSNLFVSVN